MLKRKKHQKEVRDTVRRLERSNERAIEVRELAANSMWMFQELAEKLPQTMPDIGCQTGVDSQGEVVIQVGNYNRSGHCDLKHAVDPECVNEMMAALYLQMVKDLRVHLEAEYIVKQITPNIEKILKKVDIVGTAACVTLTGLPEGVGLQHGPKTWVVGQAPPAMLCRQILVVTRQIAKLYEGCSITFDKGLRMAQVYPVTL
jgi:hypothetical protein